MANVIKKSNARQRVNAAASRTAFSTVILIDQLDEQGYVVDDDGEPVVVRGALAIGPNTPVFEATELAPERSIATLINVALAPDKATADQILSLQRKSWDDYSDEEKDLVDSARITVTFWNRDYNVELPNGKMMTSNPFEFVRDIAENSDESGIHQVEIYGLRFRAADVVDDQGVQDTVINADCFGIRPLARKVGSTTIGVATTTAATADIRSALKSKLMVSAKGTSVPTPPPAPNGSLIAAPGVDLAAYRANGWTDDQLIAHGHATKAAAVPPPPPGGGMSRKRAS